MYNITTCQKNSVNFKQGLKVSFKEYKEMNACANCKKNYKKKTNKPFFVSIFNRPPCQ